MDYLYVKEVVLSEESSENYHLAPQLIVSVASCYVLIHSHQVCCAAAGKAHFTGAFSSLRARHFPQETVETKNGAKMRVHIGLNKVVSETTPNE